MEPPAHDGSSDGAASPYPTTARSKHTTPSSPMLPERDRHRPRFGRRVSWRRPPAGPSPAATPTGRLRRAKISPRAAPQDDTADAPVRRSSPAPLPAPLPSQLKAIPTRELERSQVSTCSLEPSSGADMQRRDARILPEAGAPGLGRNRAHQATPAPDFGLVPPIATASKLDTAGHARLQK